MTSDDDRGAVTPASGDGMPRADLVCEGGGVRGDGLVGAIEVLVRHGYRFERVAGTSAGALVAAAVAGLQRAGRSVTELVDVMDAMDMRRFADASGIERVPVLGPALSILTSGALYRGDRVEEFMRALLDGLGVRTFGDLRTGHDAEPYRWSLVVTASDLSRRRLVRIPWDLPDYGIDPDSFEVARAVRASAAIPYIFRPVVEAGATWVDGGLLSGFPIEMFDRQDGLPPRWPTIGVRLASKPGVPATRTVKGPISLGIATVETLFGNNDATFVDDACTVARTVFVPTGSVSALDFGLTRAQRDELLESGRRGAAEFLSRWDFARYVATCRAPAPSASIVPPAPPER